jgi:murein DD-endopeptidase MepM/ murein hydrolase activator NlpD
MNKRVSPIPQFIKTISKECKEFFAFCLYYFKKKLINFSIGFEKNKNRLVKFFIMKRGRYNRPFLHLATMGVLGIGVLIGPYLADTYPVLTHAQTLDLTSSPSAKQSVLAGEEVFQTQISDKPRDKILTYTVEKGDTISTIARKFGVSEDTIRWGNDLSTDDISIGDQLKILPVTGIAHKVEAGDTIYSIAKKYGTDPQAIADFPFNEFANPETFSLVEGQMLIVPNGVKPSELPTYTKKQVVQIAQGPMPVASGGWYFPVQGEITQYASWYHMALDIAGSIGTPVYAAHSGTVDAVSVGVYDGGYGTNVWINDGDGIRTHYAHLNAVNVSVGQQVVGGQSVIGFRGNTGRSTGPHTHFEISVNGALVNPLSYVSP